MLLLLLFDVQPVSPSFGNLPQGEGLSQETCLAPYNYWMTHGGLVMGGSRAAKPESVSVFRSPGVGLFAPSQRGLSPRGNPRSRHRTRLEVAWDGPGPPDSAPDPSISVSILRSIFDILPWLRRPGKKGKRSPLFSCARGQKRRQMRPRHGHSEPDSEPPGLILSSSAAQEVNLSTGTFQLWKTCCQSTTKTRKVLFLGVPPSVPPEPGRAFRVRGP